MARVYVSIGSNIDPEVNINSAIHDLRETFSELLLSTVYETEPVGLEGDNFLNLVIGFDTLLLVHQVAAHLDRIEGLHDRRRSITGLAPRSLDLDLLLYDDLVINESGLQLPRSDIIRYAFVLRPLAEIAAHRVHPVTGQTFSDMWQAYTGDISDMKAMDLAL